MTETNTTKADVQNYIKGGECDVLISSSVSFLECILHCSASLCNTGKPIGLLQHCAGRLLSEQSLIVVDFTPLKWGKNKRGCSE